MTVKVTMNSGWEKALTEQIQRSPEWAKLQQKANESLRGIVREVNSEMRGGQVDAIHTELSRRLRDVGIEPNANLKETARAIADGTLR